MTPAVGDIRSRRYYTRLCALAANAETPSAPARARLAAAIAALAQRAPIAEESAAKAALRRFKMQHAVARAFAGDLHVRSALAELEGGDDAQTDGRSRAEKARVADAKARLDKALVDAHPLEDAQTDAQLLASVRKEGGSWDPPRCRVLAAAASTILARDPRAWESSVATRVLLGLARLVRRIDDVFVKKPTATGPAKRLIDALVDDVGTTLPRGEAETRPGFAPSLSRGDHQQSNKAAKFTRKRRAYG